MVQWGIILTGIAGCLIVVFAIIDKDKCSISYCSDSVYRDGYCSFHYTTHNISARYGSSSSSSSSSSYGGYGSSSTNTANKCLVPGCKDTRYSGSKYCYSHKCRDDDCDNKKVESDTFTYYCEYHTCKNPGCYNHYWYTKGKWKGYCLNCPSSIVNSQKNNNYSNSHSSSSSKKDMPDCDDYDSYEEFMDDWDGDMPDGSDASDYWDDW